jgi:4-amino-4-deoxy-L-arabinose transferase-like glycosyltransferase
MLDRVAARETAQSGARSTALDLALLFTFALALRLVTYNGAFGSDDGTYFGSALDVATGTWSAANYNGALRYGFNIPAGLFVALFGATTFVANLWPLACSLVEVAVVYVVAQSAFGRRAGVFGALLLASAPLHIAVATRIHADAVVSMFISLSFGLLWFGWRSGNRWLLWACGLSIGSIFWAKELVAVTWLAFLPMLWLFRGRWRDTVPVFGGLLIMLALHGVLMTVLNGHPLHLVRTVLAAVRSKFIEEGMGEDAAAYYLRYLFVDIRHTGLLGFLALGSVLFLTSSHSARGSAPQARVGLAFVGVWFLALLAVLSILPVSLSPLRFVMKQSNYITLFLGPMAILAGFAVAALPLRAAVSVVAVCVLTGVALGLLQQADYRVFTANSKALALWSTTQPGALIVGSTNNSSLGNFWVDQTRPGVKRAAIIGFDDAGERTAVYERWRSEATAVYAVLDRQTMNWFAGRQPVTRPLPCWGGAIHRLEPADLALGNHFAAALSELAKLAAAHGLPGASTTATAFAALAAPKPAEIHRVEGSDALCRAE